MHEVTFTPEELAAAKEQLDAQKAAEQLKQDVLSMPEEPEPEEVMARPLKASDIFPMTRILCAVLKWGFCGKVVQFASGRW